MKKRLPKTLKLQTISGEKTVPIVELGSIDVPTNPTPRFGRSLEEGWVWDGHTKTQTPQFLRTWTLPKAIKQTKEKIERVLEDGIPDVRRTVRWNQEDGFLDDRFVSEIALGENMERPFWRWSRAKADTVHVAICMDSACAAFMRAELVESRMIVSAALASALESLGYIVTVVASEIMSANAQPREGRATTVAYAAVLKGEDEPLVDSGFAHFADTGLRRMTSCWVMDADNRGSQVTDREWRDLTQADLFVYVGSRDKHNDINTVGLPSKAVLGPTGDDAIRLGLDRMSDLDSVVEQLKGFFQRRD